MSVPPIGTMLCGSEKPPAKPTADPLRSCWDFETTYTGNVGNDMGMSTMGYRSARYNYPEWHEANYAKYYQSFADRDNAQRNRHVAGDVIRETEELTNRTQQETSRILAEKLTDLHFWRSELRREIHDTVQETECLLAQKLRMENSLRTCEIALHIVTDNLNCRERREGIDLAQDDVEINLLKEVETINNAQDLLRSSIRQAEEQIRRNRDRKHELEVDWSDKKETDDLDSFNYGLMNECTCKQFYSGAAKFQEVQSTPESWAQFTHDNITRAEHERMSSIQLRTLIDNVLQDITRDICEQADAVNLAYARRTDEVEDARCKLKENLKKCVDEVCCTEKVIADLKQAIKDKEAPMKVAQTRLHKREARPGVEMCRDLPHYHLVGEVHEIARTLDALMQRLNASEHALKDLQDERLALEKDVAIKTNSLFIDRQKCMAHRTRYPTTQKLMGYHCVSG